MKGLSVSLEQNALAEILGVKSNVLRYSVVVRAFDIADAGSQDITVIVPEDHVYLIRSCDVWGYTKDANNNYAQADRVYGFAQDAVTFQVLRNGVAMTDAIDYHYFLGGTSIVFGGGNNILRVAYATIGSGFAQRVYLVLSGFTATEGLSDNVFYGALLSSLSAAPLSPGTVS